MINSNLGKFNFSWSMGNRTGFFVLFIWILLSVISSTTAYAHRVVVFAWIEGGMVYTQSKFPGGARVSGGEITVLDESGQVLLNGKTDGQGEFSFPLPILKAPSELKIVLNAGMGHQGHWTLTRDEVGRAMGMERQMDDSAVAARPDTVARSLPASTPETTAPVNMPCRLDEAELDRIVAAAVDRKLSPVMDMLISIREEAAIGLDDVIAGVGYIFGLTGLLAWFYSRKKG